MSAVGAPAPYHSPRQYLPLRLYRARGLSVKQWAEEQFELDVSSGLGGGDEFTRRSERVLELMDQLPLQAKDLIRGLVSQLRLLPASHFEVDELGNWRPGEVRINCDPAQVAALQGWPPEGNQVRQLLQTTLVHECGHALLEDPRGGVPLRSFLHLLVVSGWLPHPRQDPVPFRDPGCDPEQLTEHLVSRLRGINPRWDPGLPVGAPQQPPAGQLDGDLMGSGRPTAFDSGFGGRGLGLRGPRQLGRELLDATARGSLTAELGAVGLSAAQVWRAANRFRPVSSYSEDLISETPAEIFRQLHRGRVPWRTGQTALREGDRLLIQPWRDAELLRGRPEPAPQPTVRHRQLTPGRS